MTTRNVDFPDGYTNDTAPTVSGASWGGITGTLSSQADLSAALAAKAPLASPALTGNPTAPTPSPGDNDTSIATTAFVTAAVAAAPGGVTSVYTRTGAVVAANGDYTASQVTNAPAGGIAATTVQDALNELDTEKANLASPTFTGTPAAPTATSGTSTTQIATTAFVGSEIARLGGGINYITDRDGSSIGSWAAYADAAGTSPVDGTGGSPVSTFAISTDSSLAGTSNFIFTKGAANRQGEGFSVPFSIDAGYQSKPLKITALYKIASGSFVDNDMSVWVYDVTNSTLIACTPQYIKNSTGVEQIAAEFQAAYNSTSYRLIFHVGSTSASAYTIRFDSVSVSPTVFIAGASVSDWVNYSLTIGGTSSAPTLGTNTNTAQYRRVGDSIELRYNLAQTAGGSAGSGDYLFPLPSGLSIDTTKTGLSTNANGTSAQVVGFGVASNTTTANASTVRNCQVVPYNSTNVRLIDNDGSNQQPVSSSHFSLNGSPIYFSLFATIPVLGWGSSQILSTDTDTRIVDFAAVGSGGAVTGDVTNVPTTAVKDSHGAWTGSTYVVPVPGDYMVLGTFAAPNISSMKAWVNGVNTQNCGTIAVAGIANTMSGLLIDLKAGDIVSFRSDVSQTLTTANFKLIRVSGPAQIAASEKVYLQYTNNGGTSLTANVTNITWSTKVVDSHGAWNGTTFTAPRSSWYIVNGFMKMDTGNTLEIYSYKNGTQNVMMSHGASTARAAINGGIYLLAGETLTLRSDVSVTLLNTTNEHTINIVSQG